MDGATGDAVSVGMLSGMDRAAPRPSPGSKLGTAQM